MSERGMRPKLPKSGQAVLKAVEAFSSPLVPADYLELINPLWSTRELRGRIVKVKFETEDAATIVIKPGFKWVGHEPGQYLRIGIDIDGVRHWRAYSLSSDAGRKDGCLTITVKKVDEGKVSPFLVRRAVAGSIVTLSDVEGTFTLPDPVPEKMLFVTAGSGITPIMAMLRHLDRTDAMPDIVHVHSAPTERDAIFREELKCLHDKHNGVQLHMRETKNGGRFAPDHLDELCPDWREREAFVCGPEEMLDAMTEHFADAGLEEQLHFESFTAKVGGGPTGEGGSVTFLKSGTEATCDGGTPILEAGENEGLELPYGCRMGICHTCVGTLKSGNVRDLRSGEVHGEAGDTIRTCIHAPEGAIEIDL